MALNRNAVIEPAQNRRDQRLALGIVFGALGAAAFASLFVALSPKVVPKGVLPPPRVIPEAHRADLTIDVEAAVTTARAAALRAEETATEAEALVARARARRGRAGVTFARLTLRDGKVYEGEANNGSPEGVGIMRGGVLAFAAGFFVDGVRSGPGADCAEADCTGASYFGDFRANVPTGSARVTFPDGAIYRGDVRDGAPDGFGELTRPDGSKFSGAFTAGRRDGHGVETSAAGVVRRGFWTADQLSEPLPS